MERYIGQLKRKVELVFGGDIGAPSSIDRLNDDIRKKIGGQGLSMSTVKRLWGKTNDRHTPMPGTLEILARYAGYKGWKDFCLAMDGVNSSDFIGTRVLRSLDMHPGDTVRLGWNPSRTCTLRYLGDGRYEVVEQRNSKLSVGATFHADIIAHGQPLFVTNLVIPGADAPVGYIAGKTHGVEILE